MKKILVISLVSILVLSLGAMAFAGSFNQMRGGNSEFRAENKNFASGNQREIRAEKLSELTDLTKEEILESDLTMYEIAEEEGVLDDFRGGFYRKSNGKRNLGLSMNLRDEAVEKLAELTDLTEEEILESDLTIHELAEKEGVSEDLHSAMLEDKKNILEDLVEEGTITQEKADFMIERMENMDGSQERRGSKGGAGRGFNRK